MAQIPFFSIIIPVYNGLTHDLPVCLNSIWDQSLDKELYEVICVDDCSTDGTRQWLKEQCQEHCNLRIVENEKNIRQGGGRNRGVEAAKGKYILFIDQDDYYHKGGIDKVYEHLKENELDILVTDSAYQFKGYEHNNLQLNRKYTDITYGENYIMNNGFNGVPWRLCLNRQFYINTGITFKENCRIEDLDWGCEILYYAKRIQYQPILLIHYNKAESGTTDNMFRDKETLRSHTLASNRVLELSNTIYAKSELKKEIIELSNRYYSYTCKYLFGLFCPIKEKVEIIKLITVKKSNYKIVQMAIDYPYIFAIITNCMVPLFRLTMKIHRKRVAVKLRNGKM